MSQSTENHFSIQEYELNDQLHPHFIKGWYISPEICDGIIEKFRQQYQSKQTMYLEAPRGYHYSQLLSDHYPRPLVERYLHGLSSVVFNYMKAYEFCRPTHIGAYGIDNHINIQYWEPNSSYGKLHSERHRKMPLRNFFYITYLNDVTDNGETEFHYQNIKVQPRKGLTIISPAEWTHTHRGLPTSQDKFIATGWLEYQQKIEDPLIYIHNILGN